MSDTFGYRSKYIIYVKIFTFFTEVYIQTQRIQVGNGQYISVLFIIPIVTDIHGHRF